MAKDRPDELVNLTGFAEHDHLIVYRDDVMKFYLPTDCQDAIIMHVVEDILAELKLEVRRRAKESRYV